MKYILSDETWDQNEQYAIERVMQSNRYTMGECVKEFEEQFARSHQTRFAIMVNSGSSANLLLLAALVYSKHLHQGDEVIVPAVSWSTTYYPIYQMGLTLRFVDIDRETLNINVSQLEAAITPKTRMVMLVNLLGNPNYFDEIQSLCQRHNLLMIEDNCESMGAVYKGKKAGTFGLAGTYSTFYSHHLCTMEGGIVTTDDEELYHYMLSIRAHGWTRNLPLDSSIYKKSENPFYESFNFIVPGFNLRPLEMEGALGIEQLKKLDNIVAQRRQNAAYFVRMAASIEDIRIQKEIETSSWFGFAILLDGKHLGKRDRVVQALAKNDIEVRPIVAGNFVRNKVIEYMEHSVYGVLTNADDIHENGFFVGNYCRNNEPELDYLFEVLTDIL